MNPKDDKEKTMKISHIDCFAGPGGIATGFKAAGLDTALAIEKVKCCADTYSHNHPSVPIIVDDIRFVENSDILKNLNGQSVDIVSAGFPCETFSTAGSKSRSFYDHRQFLYQEAIRVALVAEAKFILFENVPAIKTKKAYKDKDILIVDQIKIDLQAAGYTNIHEVVLNSSNYGVPQRRERYFLIATTNSNLNLDRAIPSIFNHKVTVAEAFKGLPLLEANAGEKSVYNDSESSGYSSLMKDKEFWGVGTGLSEGLTYHIAPKHRERTLKRFSLIMPGEGLKDLFFKYPEQEVKRLQEEKILPKKWYIQRNRRLKENCQSVTVTSHCLDELIHPKLDRALTIREVARLQSFPDSYQLTGGPFICPHMSESQDKYEQVGDAVPPLLAYHIGLYLKKLVAEDRSFDIEGTSRQPVFERV